MRSSDDNFKGKFNWSEGNRKDCRKLRKYWRKSLASFLLAFILAFGPVGSAFAQEIVADKSERVEKKLLLMIKAAPPQTMLLAILLPKSRRFQMIF